MIEANQLTRRYGATVAVDGLSFDVGGSDRVPRAERGREVNTMRLILGLDSPSSGSVTVRGRPYSKIRRPLFEVGASLEASSVRARA